MNTKCSCGFTTRHSEGFSEEFGGTRAAWNTGYKTAHDTADYYRQHGWAARVFYEAGQGWSVQIKQPAAGSQEWRGFEAVRP